MRLNGLVGDVEEGEEDSGKASERQIDVETPPPGYVLRKQAPDEWTNDKAELSDYRTVNTAPW